MLQQKPRLIIRIGSSVITAIFDWKRWRYSPMNVLRCPQFGLIRSRHIWVSGIGIEKTRKSDKKNHGFKLSKSSVTRPLTDWFWLILLIFGVEFEHVMKLVKICSCQMPILTFKIRWMRMRIEEFILSVGT